MQVSIKQVYQAYQNCHKGKAKSYQAQQYDAMLVDNIFDTYLVLHTNTYQPKSYTCFIANNGSKPREIYAANFYDRVVHHYLVSNLEKIISYKFIYHSCANQVGKGTHFGVNALQKMMRQPWKGDFNRLYTPDKHSTSAVETALPKNTTTIQQYYLQLDIHNFFYSIDKKILLSILARHLKTAVKKHQINLIQARNDYRLCKIILKPCKQANKINKVKLTKIPAHKQLQNTPINKGLPIGNLTSQFFGNVYLNELDQFIKHQLKVKYYVRFVDDFVLLGSKTQLQIWQQQIVQFLQNTLALKLKQPSILKPINSGIDFLGFIIYPHYKLVRKRVIHNFYKKLTLWHNQHTKIIKQGALCSLNKDSINQIHSIFSSYIGHFKHAKYYKILLEKIQQFPQLKLLFYQNNGKYLSKTYHQFATKFSHQQQFFNHHFQGFVVILQKGKKFVSNNADQHQYHLKYLNAYLAKLQTNAQNYVFISEQGYVHNRLKQRRIRTLFIANHTRTSYV